MATKPKKFTKPATSSYSSAIVNSIMEAIAEGESLRKACEVFGIAPSTFLFWCSERPEMAERYAREKQIRAEMLADELVQIADEDPGTTDNGGTDSGAVAHLRLRVDTRKWVLSKMLPKVYGDKLAIGGAADLPPVQSSTNVTLDPSEAYKRLLAK